MLVKLCFSVKLRFETAISQPNNYMDCCCSGVETTIKTNWGECGELGRAVGRQTVVHHVNGGEAFAVDDVRELVTSKARGDERPLCYCFGFTEGDVRTEIARTGESSIPAQVTEFIKQKLCVCEFRNPAGACCLGEIEVNVSRWNLSLSLSLL